MIVSVCGKGGSGKSVVTALLAGEAVRRGHPVLVVDADESNSGLYAMLGLQSPPSPIMELLGGKEALKRSMGSADVLQGPSITPDDLPEAHLSRDGQLRLVAIGKIHQALEGCACPMGILNRELLKKLSLGDNELAIVDMEAGVEHFGRGIEEAVSAILLVVEPSMESIRLAAKIRELAQGMGKPVWAVLNKVTSEAVAGKLQGRLREHGLRTAAVIPDNASVFEACLEGGSITQGPAQEQAAQMLDHILDQPDGAAS